MRSFGTATSTVPLGIEVAVAVAVAGVVPVLGDSGVVSVADLVGLGGQDLVDEALGHLAHEVRGCLSEQFVKVGGGVDRIRASDHRRCPFRGDVRVDSKGTCGGCPTFSWGQLPAVTDTPRYVLDTL